MMIANLALRASFAISYPTRPRGIIVNYTASTLTKHMSDQNSHAKANERDKVVVILSSSISR